MIHKLILWLFGAYVVKKCPLIHLRMVGLWREEARLLKTLARCRRLWPRLTLWYEGGCLRVALPSSRESATKKTLKNYQFFYA